MKNTLILLLLSAGALYAQVPHIDYMMADEAKSQLQIHGTFGPDHTGNALIEGVPCSIRFWSDTMVICDLPDSGAGSGGHVTVEQMSGTSNTRMLSIFVMTIENPFFYVGYQSNIGTIFGPGAGQTIWNVNWRADIASRPKNVSSLVQFEISKSSKGTWKLLTYPNVELRSSDSLHFSDSSIALFGQLDLIKFKVIFMLTRMQSYPDNGVVIPNSAIPYLESYQPNLLYFDTTGYLTGYHNDDTTGEASGGTIEKHTDSLYNQKIIFSPYTKNAVIQSPQPTSDPIKISSDIASEQHQISLETEAPLGETTASLYSIDGRLLRQEKIYIPSAGMYSFDASGINARVGIFVLKTEKGIIVKKVLF